MALNPLTPNQQLRYQSYARQVRAFYQKPIAQTSTTLILTLATAAFFGFAAIKPTLTTVSQLMREIDDKQEVETKLKQKINALTAVQEEYLAYQRKLGLLDQAIPPSQNLKVLLLQIEYLTWVNQTPMTSLRVEPLMVYPQNFATPETTDTYPSYVVTIAVLGHDRAEFRPLLMSLDTLDRILRIEGVSYSESDNETYPVQMTTAVRAYWDPPSSPTPVPINH